MTEVRFEAKSESVAVIDGYCSATGKCRTAVINEILEAWANDRLREAMMICRVAGVDPMRPETGRKGGG